jgi:hypothetical protein
MYYIVRYSIIVCIDETDQALDVNKMAGDHIGAGKSDDHLRDPLGANPHDQLTETLAAVELQTSVELTKQLNELTIERHWGDAMRCEIRGPRL